MPTMSGLKRLAASRNGLGRHVHAQVLHREAEHAEGQRGHVLADVVDVAGDGAQQHPAGGVAGELVFQPGLGQLHHAAEDLARHDQTRQVDLLALVALAHGAQTVLDRVDDVQRSPLRRPEPPSTRAMTCLLVQVGDGRSDGAAGRVTLHSSAGSGRDPHVGGETELVGAAEEAAPTHGAPVEVQERDSRGRRPASLGAR